MADDYNSLRPYYRKILKVYFTDDEILDNNPEGRGKEDDWINDPEMILEEKEYLQNLTISIGQLSGVHKTVFTLNILDKMSIMQIADKIEKPYNEVVEIIKEATKMVEAIMAKIYR